MTLEQSASKRDTGLTDSTHSSSSSAERYRLDEFDDTPVLLYKYRVGLATSSQKDLCALLDKGTSALPSAPILSCLRTLTDEPGRTDESLRVTKKSIPRYTSYIDVKRHDLFLPEEKEEFCSLPNYDSSLASIKIPTLQYLSRVVFGNYDSLYIVSPETSPTSSVASSDSRRSSPTTTWGRHKEEDARLGAT